MFYTMKSSNCSTWQKYKTKQQTLARKGGNTLLVIKPCVLTPGFNRIGICCCQETIRIDCWPCVSLRPDVRSPAHFSCLVPVLSSGQADVEHWRQVLLWLMKGHLHWSNSLSICAKHAVSIIAVMKKQAFWFIVMMPWEAGGGTLLLHN